MTIAQLLGYLYQQLLEALGKYGEEDSDKLSKVSEVVSIVWDAASLHNDMKVDRICDDIQYVIGETSMGARAKGEYLLPSIKAQIQELQSQVEKGLGN